VLTRSNVELKARYPDQEKPRAILKELRASFEGVEKQVDTYFKVPAGRLKLREIAGGGSELIFYRRDEAAARRDCAYEIATIPDPSKLKDVLVSALRVDVRVAKTREVYRLAGVKINLDEVHGLGGFIEFEVRVQGNDFDGADSKVKELMKRFGIGAGDALCCSYSDMVRKAG